MAKKRQRKKQIKKTLQQQAKSILKDTQEKNIKNYSYNTLLTITQNYEKAHQRRQRQKKQKQELRNRKKAYLESLGLKPFELKLKDIDSVKVKDMDQGAVTRYNYPHLFGVKSIKNFDFQKRYKLKNDERFYFAFRDYAGETSFEEALAQFSHLSNEQLLVRLEKIVRTPPSYSRGKSASSGKAGDFKFMSAKQNVLRLLNQDTYNQNRRKGKKKSHMKFHEGQYTGFQVLKNRHRNSFDEVTPRGLLVIANALLHNITELDRMAFYQNFYVAVRKHVPDMIEFLPRP